MQASSVWAEHHKVIGNYYFATTYDTAEQAASEILAIKPIFLGFDVEAIEGVGAILSLATQNIVYLFRLKTINFEGQFPEPLLRILANNGISKVANAVPMDLKFLRPWNLHLGGLIDLQQLSRVKGYPLSLKAAFKEVFPNLPPMPELYSKEVDTWINWNGVLTEEYLVYAAYDARACYLLFKAYLGV